MKTAHPIRRKAAQDILDQLGALDTRAHVAEAGGGPGGDPFAYKKAMRDLRVFVEEVKKGTDR